MTTFRNTKRKINKEDKRRMLYPEVTFDWKGAENLLVEILSVQTVSYKTERMQRWLRTYIAQNFPEAIVVEHGGNIYVTKGDAKVYPCIVAHTDTVHAINDHVKVFRVDDWIFAFDKSKGEQYGVGGDDKVGIFVAVMMLHMLPNVKCAFFRDEEVGCIGSGLAKVDFFRDCAFVLQADRRGNADFVNDIGGKIYSDEFGFAISEYLKDHKYKESTGMMTDVETLSKKGIGICTANISCGYYHPHSDSEVVNITDAFNCTQLVYSICDNLGSTRWLHKFSPTTYYTNYGYWGERGNNYLPPAERLVPAVDTIWDKDTMNYYQRGYDKRLITLGKGTWQDPYRNPKLTGVHCPTCFTSAKVRERAGGGNWCDGCNTRVPEEAKEKEREKAKVPECANCRTNSLMTLDLTTDVYYCHGCGAYEFGDETTSPF